MICCKIGIILLLSNQVRTHNSVSIILNLQQTKIDLRQNRRNQKISHHHILRLIAATAANLRQTCSKRPILQQKMTARSGPGITNRSNHRNRRLCVLPAGRRGSWYVEKLTPYRKSRPREQQDARRICKACYKEAVKSGADGFGPVARDV